MMSTINSFLQRYLSIWTISETKATRNMPAVSSGSPDSKENRMKLLAAEQAADMSRKLDIFNDLLTDFKRKIRRRCRNGLVSQ